MVHCCCWHRNTSHAGWLEKINLTKSKKEENESEGMSTWLCHVVAYRAMRISRNVGIISNLRCYLSIQQLKQIWYSLIYPYISYRILAWGSVYKTHIMEIQVKQNRIVRFIFYARMYCRQTVGAKPLLNWLDILAVDNIYRLEVLKFSRSWQMAFSLKFLTVCFNMLKIFIDTTRDIQPNGIFKGIELKLMQESNQSLSW